MESIRIKATAILVAVILTTLVLGIVNSQPLEETQLSGAEGTFHTDKESISVDLEVADTFKERRKGLMNRTNLEKDNGMLFIFNTEDNRSFWMKNTYIPLDIVFIDSNNKIVDIKKAFPEPNTSEEELKLYKGGPAKYVLEVNQNFTERKGIEEGDKITLNIDN